MKKQTIIKEDGRTLVYYWFDKSPLDSLPNDTETKEKKSCNCSCKKNQE